MNLLTAAWKQRGLLVHDILSSVVVFLVAMPLCLGIAIACGVPPALGIVTGIVGGLLVGSLSSCPLQVSGPAAGSAVLVVELLEKHGLDGLGVVVILAGLIQLLAGCFKLGRWFLAVSPAVIHAMLAGIGILILAGQFHVMFDLKPHGSGLPSLLSMPSSLWTALHNQQNMLAGLVALSSLTTLVVWKWTGLEKKVHIPGALPAIVVAALVVYVFDINVRCIDVPSNLLSALSLPATEGVGYIIEGPMVMSALALALIASAETLLSVAALDQMHNGPRARYDRELVTQGMGNMLCGLLGALPMAGVIVRSKVNIEAGARTRFSTVLHGAWLLIAVVFFASVLSYVPVAGLAALLVYTGYKLVDLRVLKELREHGQSEVMIYFATVVMIIATDLLVGVLTGVLLALAKMVWTVAMLEVKVVDRGVPMQVTLVLRGSATFLGVPYLTEQLNALPTDKPVAVDFSRLIYIDHACLHLLESWDKRQRHTGGSLVVDWDGLSARNSSPCNRCA